MSTVVEYICPDCGTLLIHENHITLESIKDVHSQLCVVKRQQSLAAAAQLLKPTTTQKPSVAKVQEAVAPATSTASQPTMPAPTALGADTTISFTGSGTNYSKAEGPIDPEFKSRIFQALCISCLIPAVIYCLGTGRKRKLLSQSS